MRCRFKPGMTGNGRGSAGGEGKADDEGAFGGNTAFGVPDGVGGAGSGVVTEEEVDGFAGMDLPVVTDLDVGQLM